MRTTFILRVISSFVLVTILSCGGEDSSLTGTNGNGGTSVLISASQNDWSAKTSYRTWGSDCFSSSWVVDDPAIGRVLANNRFGTEGNGLPEKYGDGRSCCYYSEYASVATSKTIDLTPYKTARVKGRVVATAGRQAGGCPLAGVGGSVVIDVLSNVPGTPNLVGVVAVDLDPVPCPSDGSAAEEEVSFDVSLENALGFQEATLSLKLNWKCTCYASDWTWGTFYVHDFRVEGEK